MKKIFLITAVLLLCSISSIRAQEEVSKTTYYLLRHAEKDRSDATNKNPNLTDVGRKRAEKWSQVFSKTTFDAIYSTNYNRTIQTAEPTAKAQSVTLQLYDPRNLFSDSFKNETAGKTVLIVGHSNTTPMFVNKIIGKDAYKDIDDNDNSLLFIVTVIGNESSVQVLSIN